MDNRVKQFNDIEKKYDLYHDKIGKINYWMYARFDIWNYIFSILNPNMGKANNTPQGIIKKLKAGLGLLLTILFGKKVKKKDIDILFLNHERKVKADGLYECKYTEAISKMYKNIYIFERPYERKHFKPTNTENLIYLDKIAVKGKLNYQFIRHFHRREYEQLLNLIKARLSLPIEELETELQIVLDQSYIARLVAKKILICEGEYKEYKKIFDKIHPKLIIEVVYYNMDCMIINEIAKKEGIRTVELQHGNIFSTHIPYHYADTATLNQLPDEIWLLSEYWKNAIHVPIDNQNLVTVGFPYFETRIKKYQNRYRKRDNQKTILFISQWTIGKQLSEFAVAFAELCRTQRFRILYKLHPGEISTWKEEYTILAQSTNIEVIDNMETDLYQLFAQSDVQVGVYSTAIYEGLGFGLDTFICDLPRAEDMEELYKRGYAILVKTPEELCEFLQKDEKISTKQLEFWKKDSLNNINEQIKRILLT